MSWNSYPQYVRNKVDNRLENRKNTKNNTTLEQQNTVHLDKLFKLRNTYCPSKLSYYFDRKN